MPTDEPQALQVFGTLAERLAMAVGYPAVVYLMGVHAPMGPGTWLHPPGGPHPGMPLLPPSGTPQPGSTASPDWCPPRPGPGPAPGTGPGSGTGPGTGPGMGGMMQTEVLYGVVAFAGANYLDLQVCVSGKEFREVLIPYSAVGMIIPGGPTV